MKNKEVEQLIRGIVSMWEEDTCHLSFHCPKHPAFSIIKKLYARYPDVVITAILKIIEEEVTWFFTVFYSIIPEEERPEMPQGIQGKINEQAEIWIKWGYEKGYLQ